VANASALTTTETLGLNLFTGKAGCVACHSGPQLTNAGTPAFAALASGVIADRMSQADSNPGIYDFGFYNIGVRGTSHDVGVGGTDPFGNPLSFTRQAISGVNKDIFTLTPCAFSTGACTPVSSTERATVDGAFKTPTLRNVALTGPYFHDGSLATLEDVVQFYIRRGNARATTNGDTSGFGANTSNLAGQFPRIELSGAETAALVQFLRTALTDAPNFRWWKVTASCWCRPWAARAAPLHCGPSPTCWPPVAWAIPRPTCRQSSARPATRRRQRARW
jgi:cytochrome c peroxidase